MRPGDVVSLRVRSSAGPRDLVGVLVAAGPTHLSVRRRDGSIERVAVDDVAAGRVVPPGPAQRIGVDELQRVMAQGWRGLETAELDGWLLRAGGGFTGRANSALVATTAVPDLPARLAAVRAWYDDRGLPSKLQVPAGGPPGLDDVLAAEAWDVVWPTTVMTAEAAHILRAANGPADVTVRLDEQLDDAWLAAYRNDEGPLPPAARGVLGNHDSVVFASVREAGECVAIARVAVDGRWAGLFAVEVSPAHRRRGLAQAVTAAAVRWGVERGARRTYLQVVTANDAAVALWERLGFRRHHEYVYRTLSGSPRGAMPVRS